MDLFSKAENPKLVNKYVGEKITPGHFLYTPIKIHHYEFIDSMYREGNRVLVAQVSYIDKTTQEIKNGMLFTEGYNVVKVLMSALDAKPPHYTKFVKNKNGYITLSALNRPEKEKLKNVPDPCPTDTPVIDPNLPKPNKKNSYKNNDPFKGMDKKEGEED